MALEYHTRIVNHHPVPSLNPQRPVLCHIHTWHAHLPRPWLRRLSSAQRHGNKINISQRFSEGSGTRGLPSPITCQKNGDHGKSMSQQTMDRLVIVGTAVVLAAVVTVAGSIQQDDLADAIYGDGISTGLGSAPGRAGDLAAGLLWAVSLYFCSPLQLLLLFLGRIETERPSDRVLRQLGRLSGQPLEDPEYSAPAYLQLPTVLLFLLSGFAVSAALSASLGDATWGVSTGIGSCFAAAIYEVGRPTRLSSDEAMELESRWQDFAQFAEERLRRSGRCHESEIRDALAKSDRGFRGPNSLSDSTLRDMIRNWHPAVDRTATGYYKNLSLRAKIDPFTGQTTGSEDAVPAPRRQADK